MRVVSVLIVIVLLAALVLAQQGAYVENISKVSLAQGQRADIDIRGAGLLQYDRVSISPSEGIDIQVEETADDKIELEVEVSCDAEVGDHAWDIGGITEDQDNDGLILEVTKGNCTTTDAAEEVVETKQYVGGLFPRGVEQGKTQQAYFTGTGLLNVEKVVIVGTGLTVKILAGGTDEKLPLEFTSDPKGYVGGRGLIVVFKDGTEQRVFPDSGVSLRFDVVEAKAVVTREPAPEEEKEEETKETALEADVKPVQIAVEPEVPQACDDIAFFFNEKPIGAEVRPVDGKVTFALQRAEGIMIHRLRATSSSAGVQRALNDFFRDFVGDRADRCMNSSKSFDVPKSFPAGTTTVKVVMVYSDADLARHEIAQDFTVVVDEGGRMAKLLPGDAQDAMIAKFGGPPKRIERELTYNELSAEDFERLGISKEDIRKGMALWRTGDKEGAKKLLGDLKKIKETRKKHTDDELTRVDESKRKAMDDNSKGGIDIDPEVDVRVFEIERDGKKVVRSKVIIEIPAQKFLGEGEVVIYVPKELASSASELDFSDEMIVVEEDPVVKWAFKNVPQDQYREYSFTVEGDAQDFEVVAQAAADNPALLTRFILWVAGMFGGSK